MRRGAIFAMSGLLLAAVGCGGVKGPQHYAVGVDAASPPGKNFQYSAFFPAALRVRPGDSITFENRSTQAPHTITFGIDGKRSNQPPVVLPTGENPVVREPCFAEGPPTADLTKCPFTKLPAYGGTGYWNSGFLVPSVAPSGPKKVTVELAGTIEPGQYRYVCILHRPMSGVIDVVAKDDDRVTTEKIVEIGQTQLTKVRADAASIPEPKLTTTGNVVPAAAGWSNAVTAVNRFSPDTVEIRAGQSVSWEAYSVYEPHTVSFGAFQSGSGDQKAFAPSGVPSGGTYTGGDANSGIFGAKGGPFPPGPFTLTFTNPGEYSYVCVLHPGMTGKVKVT